MQNKLSAVKPWLILISLIIAPTYLLRTGFFGFFLFTFSIPIFWKILFNQPWQALGINRKKLIPSILTGLITGASLGVLGGGILRSLGITGYKFDGHGALVLNFGLFRFDILLAREPGYRLLPLSDTFGGLFIYFLFFIFVVGLGEELFWRGFIQKRLSYRMTNAMAITLTSFLFVMAHSYLFVIMPVKEGLLLLGLIGIASGIWGFLFKWFDNLWGVALSHGIAAPIIWKYYFFNWR